MSKTLEKIGPGALVLVVGPSGAGKDTLIAGARQALRDDNLFSFPRRLVTRVADPGLEDHDSIDEATYSELTASGQMAIHWRAHGLGYGLPPSVNDDIRDGCVVVHNVSRSVIGQARAAYENVFVLHITAPDDVLTKRLAARGRESAEEIKRRIARASAIPVTGDDVVVIENAGPIEKSISQITEVLRRISKALQARQPA